MSWSEPYPWALAVAACAGLAIWGHRPGRMPFHWVGKPLTTVLLLVVAALMVDHTPSRPWILLALALSLVGDVSLMFPKGFAAGLGAFLAGLLAYAWAFSLQIPFAPRQLVYLLLPAAVAGAVLRGLWPSVSAYKAGRYRVPVLLYVAALTLMAWRAISRFDAVDFGLRAWVYGVLGAACFITGDALLARRRFAERPAPYSIELGVYYLAQWCLIASMW